MTQVLYDDLWHYSERFTRDKLQRSELLTMAYVQGLKMGAKGTPKLMKSASPPTFTSKQKDVNGTTYGLNTGPYNPLFYMV